MTKDEALDLALEALIYASSYCDTYDAIDAITAIKQARALDKMAENARQVGLDYEPSAGTRVSKVWWDGEKLMAKPIPLEDFYKPAQQEPVAWVNQADLNSAAIQRNRGGQGDTHTWSETPTWDHSVPLYTSPPAQQESVAWQLIETAPQDGTKILGWNEKFGARETQMNFYGEGSLGFAAWKSGKGPKESGWNWSEPKSNWGHTWEPTHWKPLLTPFNTTPPAPSCPECLVGLCHCGLRKAEQPAQQEPVAWMTKTGSVWKTKADETDEPLYTHPPAQRKPLTDEEIESINVRLAGSRDLARLFARAIEAKLKEKNT